MQLMVTEERVEEKVKLRGGDGGGSAISKNNSADYNVI